MNNHDWETTDILICGCGPTGALLSTYLGQMRISNVVLEKEANITTDPRGIALDEDGIRILQGAGLYDSIYTEIGSCMGKFNFISGSGKNLMKQPFVSMDYNTTAGGTGHVGYICHKQPVLEKKLREAMLASSTCSLRSKSTVVDLKEDDDWTYCTYKNAKGTERRIRARFFVGADGKTGFTRKQYLEEKSVFMEKVTDIFYDETWVALNWEITLPTPQSHPNFPLWELGYTPEQVYDLFFPPNFRFLCNPNRPAVCGRFGLPNDRLWRFEFFVQPHEDGYHMATREMIQTIVFPYITHSGSQYGLPGDVQFPQDCINILRSRPFTFSARSCNVWAKDRVILCGDSAHVFPPFGGQGIASGFRDALSLAWRLAMLCRYHPSNTRVHHEVLRSWYLERKQQLEKSLAATIENGKFVTESQPLKAWARDWYFWLIQLVPSWKRQLELGRRRDGMVRYRHTNGMPFIPELNGGLSLPQVYGKRTNGEVVFTDDIIFSSSHGGLFHIFVYLHNSQEIQEVRKVLREVEQLSKGTIVADNVPIILEELKSKEIEDCPNDIIQLATGEDFAGSSLCNQRPKPMLYDPFTLGREVRGRYCIVRSDRFIYAACNEIKELREAVQRMLSYLHQT
ncbi:hypothetical protein CNMCM8980_003080 [Aspergillus fumigatiaffinis]|nr:hypothetical protein CNMCM5878_003268 [Aspergillus fumigatiaffinis]KAF4236315.1 hypothetical protein CNMCM6457_002297 [Aspergillus fumigatiaffinis]KAF4249591.1 hypothetical protein CNMCM8980_003080 [Aspergillus fumigatiaffinis]